MHPGWADTPGVQESLPTFSKVVGPLLRSPEQGADTLAVQQPAVMKTPSSLRFNVSIFSSTNGSWQNISRSRCTS